MPANYIPSPRTGLNQQGSNQASYFVGRVAEDKKPNSRIIKVFIKDLLPYYEGELKPKEAVQQVSGGVFQGKLTTTNVVEAEWMGDESNRRFPPDVKVNEQVQVIIYSDQDKIYWRSLGRDDDKRRTERLELNAANTPNGPSPVNKENSYSIEMDTQDKKEINIQTSKTGGEEFAYVVKINAKESKLFLSDDANNEVCIDSKTPRVYMRNGDGTMIELAKKTLTIIAPEDFLVKVGRQVVWDVPNFTMKNTGGTGITVWESAQMVMKMQSFLVQASCIGLQGAVEANSIVSGSHYATSYATIDGVAGRQARGMAALVSSRAGGRKGFSTYAAPAINVYNGTGTRANNSPNLDGGFTSNRHCAAWEEISAAVHQIAEDLIKIDGRIGYGNSADVIKQNADASKMDMNTGK